VPTLRTPLPAAVFPAVCLAGSLLAALAAPLAVPLTAQERPTPQFEGAMEVREVLLDVLVTDEAGNVVVGLGKDDFVIEEDGEAVPVVSASFYSNRRYLGGFGGQTEPAAGPSDVPEDRYFVLFYYWPPLLRSSERTYVLRLPQAGRMSFQWMVEELLPNDHVAVVSYDTSLHLHHDFSRDRDRLGEAVRRASTGKAPLERWTSRTETPEEGITLTSLPQGQELLKRSPDVLDGLRVLAQALGDVGGRKNLIVFGAELPPEGSTEWMRGYAPLVEALNVHNVAAYTIGVTGSGRQPSLIRLAEDTGGEYAYRFDSFLSPLRKIAQENSGYYLLSFESRHPAGESGYQEIEVRAVNPEFRVRSRGGYRYGGAEGP
jgi:VWFA-related protein